MDTEIVEWTQDTLTFRDSGRGIIRATKEQLLEPCTVILRFCPSFSSGHMDFGDTCVDTGPTSVECTDVPGFWTRDHSCGGVLRISPGESQATHALGGAKYLIQQQGGPNLLAVGSGNESLSVDVLGRRDVVFLVARLVVLACEVDGRWSDESRHFLRQWSKAKARQEPPLMQKRVRHAWLFRWGSMLACTGARALALSLLEQRGGRGADGPTPPNHDVVWEARYVT